MAIRIGSELQQRSGDLRVFAFVGPASHHTMSIEPWLAAR